MATGPEESLQRLLNEKGFFSFEDVTVGERLLAMEGPQRYFLDELKLSWDTVFLEPRVESVIIDSFRDYGGCTLGHAMTHGSYPGRIICFRQDENRRSILVLLWPKGSRAKFWVGSHRLNLPVSDGPEYHLYFSQADLENTGCTSELGEFPKGGVTVLDARLGFEKPEGDPFILEFATNDVVARWTPMVLPKTPELEAKVTEMKQATAIGLNYRLVELEDFKKMRTIPTPRIEGLTLA